MVHVHWIMFKFKCNHTRSIIERLIAFARVEGGISDAELNALETCQNQMGPRVFAAGQRKDASSWTKWNAGWFLRRQHAPGVRAGRQEQRRAPEARLLPQRRLGISELQRRQERPLS